MKYQNHNKNLKSLEKHVKKSFLPAKLSLFFVSFQELRESAHQIAALAPVRMETYFTGETDGKKEKKQNVDCNFNQSVYLYIYIYKDFLMFFLHLNVSCCSSMVVAVEAAASVFSNHLRAWERLGLKLSSLCVEFGETRFHYWTIGSLLGHLAFLEMDGNIWWL